MHLYVLRGDLSVHGDDLRGGALHPERAWPSDRRAAPLPVGHKEGRVPFASPFRTPFLLPLCRSCPLPSSLRDRDAPGRAQAAGSSAFPRPAPDQCFPFQRREEPVHHRQRGVRSRQDGVRQVRHALFRHGGRLGQRHQHRREGPGVQSHHGGKASQRPWPSWLESLPLVAGLLGAPLGWLLTRTLGSTPGGQHSRLSPRACCPLPREKSLPLFWLL